MYEDGESAYIYKTAPATLQNTPAPFEVFLKKWTIIYAEIQNFYETMFTRLWAIYWQTWIEARTLEECEALKRNSFQCQGKIIYACMAHQVRTFQLHQLNFLGIDKMAVMNRHVNIILHFFYFFIEIIVRYQVNWTKLIKIYLFGKKVHISKNLVFENLNSLFRSLL